MKMIWKYGIEVTDEFMVQMPEGAKLLTVQLQFNEPQMWALLDPTAPMVNRRIRVVGTGHWMPDADALTYVASFQLAGGQLIFHVFDAGEVLEGVVMP